ncbi:hypothetical protein GOP47_0018155 [Adiantum capillus-veneris]|uniref:Secreted protein n=1 Tax=Adiantum capillus-veneris TaxID=13818 RepID=A0A9D4ZBC3_ADICA|nr:hypothetical protein GOP47_0018155 [Adiantum capillus-veneris]
MAAHGCLQSLCLEVLLVLLIATVSPYSFQHPRLSVSVAAFSPTGRGPPLVPRDTSSCATLKPSLCSALYLLRVFLFTFNSFALLTTYYIRCPSMAHGFPRATSITLTTFYWWPPTCSWKQCTAGLGPACSQHPFPLVQLHQLCIALLAL